MNPERALALITMAFATCQALAPILQIRQMRRTGSSRDLSLAWLGLTLIAQSLWISRGTLYMHDWVVILSNVLADLTIGASLATALWYRRRRRSALERAA